MLKQERLDKLNYDREKMRKECTKISNIKHKIWKKWLLLKITNYQKLIHIFLQNKWDIKIYTGHIKTES